MSAATAVTHPGPKEPRVSPRARFWIVRLGSLAALLLAWQWYGSQPDQFAVAPPTGIIEDLWEGIRGAEFVTAMLGTMRFMVVGLAIATVIGVGIGLLIAASDVADNTLTPIVNSAYASPMTLLIPIIGVYTGIDFWGKVVIVTVFAVFVILINTEAGVRSVPADMLETAEAFALTKFQLVKHVIAPAATPYIMAGLRLGVGRAFRGAIVADLLLSVANMGEVLVSAGSTFNVNKLLAGIVFTTIVGYGLLTLTELLERRLTRWRSTSEA